MSQNKMVERYLDLSNTGLLRRFWCKECLGAGEWIAVSYFPEDRGKLTKYDPIKCPACGGSGRGEGCELEGSGRRRIEASLLDRNFSEALHPMADYRGYAEIMTVEEFRSACRDLLFIDEDGCGLPAWLGLVQTAVTIVPSRLHEIPAEATHIVWPNR